MKTISGFAVGLDAAGRQSLFDWMREVGLEGCPIFHALRALPELAVTRSRPQILADRDWYRSTSFEYRRRAYIDHQLTSLYQGSCGRASSGLTLHRASGEGDFSARQQQVFHFLHGELWPLIGRSLVSAAEPSPDGLSPRLSQTLACLLEGDSEKQVAARLGLSLPTTHQYVTALYRHFGVRSRAQLLALALRRLARGSWAKVLQGLGAKGDES